MQLRTTLSAFALSSAALLIGCQNMSPDAMLQSGLMAVQAATLSDAEVRSMSDQACAEMDAEANISGPNNPYSKRLDKIVNNLGHQINGTPITYKVYQADDVNAWAMANGCARVYSGLMDLMTDNNDAEGLAGLPQWPVRAAGQACRLADVSLLPDADEHPARRATEVAAGERRLTEQPAQAHARRQPHLIQAQPVRQRAQ